MPDATTVTRRGFLAGAAGLALSSSAGAAMPAAGGERLVLIVPAEEAGLPEPLLRRFASERADLAPPGRPVLHVSRRGLGPAGLAVASLDPSALRLVPASRLVEWLGRPGRIAPAGPASLAPGFDWAALGRLLAQPGAPRLVLAVPAEGDDGAGEREIAALRTGLGAGAAATRILLPPWVDRGGPW